MAPLFEARGLHLRFGDRVVLEDVSLAFPAGTLTGIMGPNGAGKTTCFNLLTGRYRPDRGQVLFGGRDITGMAPHRIARLGIARSFQLMNLFDEFSVFENVAFQLREKTDLPESMIRDIVLMKLNAVGLRGAAQLMPSELSGGMARRVGLSRAIAMDPCLMMYDEPFSGLDPISCNVIGNLIRKLNDALGLTSIVVSYDAKEALEIVDYVYFIADGKVVAQGTTAEVQASKDPFVYQFIRGDPDGPVAFHMSGGSYSAELGVN